MGRHLPPSDNYKLPHDIDLAALAVRMIPIVGELFDRFSEGSMELMDYDQFYKLLEKTGLGTETIHSPEIDGPIEDAEPGDLVIIYTAEALQIREIFRNATANSSGS